MENFIDDEKACEQFIRNTCDYKKAPNNKPCSSLFSVLGVWELCRNKFGNNDGVKESRIIPEF